MDALDKLFIACAAISIIVAAIFGYLVLIASGWPLAILTAIIMVPLLLISGLTTSESLAKPFCKKNHMGEVKLNPAISIVMAVVYYVVIAIVLYFVFSFARLI